MVVAAGHEDAKKRHLDRVTELEKLDAQRRRLTRRGDVREGGDARDDDGHRTGAANGRCRRGLRRPRRRLVKTRHRRRGCARAQGRVVAEVPGGVGRGEAAVAEAIRGRGVRRRREGVRRLYLDGDRLEAEERAGGRSRGHRAFSSVRDGTENAERRRFRTDSIGRMAGGSREYPRSSILYTASTTT